MVLVGVSGVPIRRLVPNFGRFRLLVLHFLHLQEAGLAELLAQALDEADGVDAVADHLQPVLAVAGCRRFVPRLHSDPRDHEPGYALGARSRLALVRDSRSR
jgi:hypothetical protein